MFDVDDVRASPISQQQPGWWSALGSFGRSGGTGSIKNMVGPRHTTGVEPEEGWFTDPFARHEHRWMSNGRPTKLVRDDGRVAYDEPPETGYIRLPERIERPARRGGSDLRRADDAEAAASTDPDLMVWDVVFSDGAPLPLLGLDTKDEHSDCEGDGRG